MMMTTDDDLNDPCDFVTVEAESNPDSLQQWLSTVENGKANGTRRSDISTKAKKHLSSLGWRFAYFPKRNKKRELRYKSPKGKWFYYLATACSSCVHEDDDGSRRELIVPESDESPRDLSVAFIETVSGDNVSRRRKKRVKDCETAAFSGNKALIVSKKRKERVNVGETAAFSGTKVVLIVDVSKKRKRVSDCETTAFNGVALKEEKNHPLSDILNVDVINQQEKKRMAAAAFNSKAKGEIRPRFEKSLRKVLQVMEKKNETCEKESVRFWRKDCGPEKNCDVCCVCHFGGELLLCDGCPSAFHHTCIGLHILPEEELWFCPCCCCDICGSMVTLGNSKLMTCEQCQRRFHLKCLKQETCLVSCRGWFCSKQCSRVYSGLQSLLGRKIVVGEEGLVWSLIRAPNDGEHYDDEQMAKLDSAVEILHQGFEPSTDPFSGRDLVEELIYRKDASGVGRGFYTVLVERNNEPVTVAAMRVDKDVAEIPLVATLSSYRRSGMCRVLMDELEKQMSRMGVRRLVLPAAKEVVSTWSQGFGFKVMDSWERLEFVKHGMLDFVGTVMCSKFLREREVSGESSLTE
ncbi:hypothetical protein IGI04_033630 [Brassica rapa subsp. trilocularis]|uniref:PHD-type domain-containing protein n=1 Tax=Brassica rapa subsp. trilocularis TaxID=1813537 RepID=A0ABQ7L8H6_BRACM|nr:hypothetical protein IGI04_033630 [Brassica rapa subsp. trilocularis]